jgi:hypothetical protein
VKKLVLATSLFILSSAPSLLVAGQITSECQSQAKEYAVEPELVSQYVKDCVTSMGGEAPASQATTDGADSASRSNPTDENTGSDPVELPGATAIQ